MNYRESIDFHINEENGEVSAVCTGDDLKGYNDYHDKFNLIFDESMFLYFEGDIPKEELEDRLITLKKVHDRSNTERVEVLGNYYSYLEELNNKKLEELASRITFNKDVEAYQLLNDYFKASDVITKNMVLYGKSLEEVVDSIIKYIWDVQHECMNSHWAEACKLDEFERFNHGSSRMPYVGCHYTFDGRYLSYMNYDRDFGTYLNELKERLMKEYSTGSFNK